MHCPFRPNQRIARCAGFSLVEVALSLAVMGYTCIVLIGLIPMGLTSFHEAMGNTVETEIVQNLTNDMLLANFSNLYQYSYSNNGNLYYCYDYQGSPLGTGSASSLPAGTVYKAQVGMTGVGSANSPASLIQNSATSGASNSTSANTSAYNVTITITSPSNPSQSDSFPIIVANNNQ